MTVATGPLCILCDACYSLAPGSTTAVCPDPRNAGVHIVRNHPIPPEDRAVLDRKAAPDTKHPMQVEWEKTDAYKAADATSKPAPTPFDAAVLRAGKPTGQTSLF